MGTLSEWLTNRHEENILNKAVAHVQKTLECVVEFERGFTFFIKEGNIKVAHEVFVRVDILEHEADILRREILRNISVSQVPSNIREDLIHLVKRIDRIANATNAAARKIICMNEQDIKSIGENILNKMLEIIHLSVEAAKVLFNLFKKLASVQPKEIFQYTEQIQVLEHKCDILHGAIYTDLNKQQNVTISPFIAIQITQLIDIFEEISDKIEDVADYIELVKSR